MPLQYIYTLFLEHDLSLGALAMETVAQQKRDYCQVSPHRHPGASPTVVSLGGSWSPEILGLSSVLH